MSGASLGAVHPRISPGESGLTCGTTTSNLSVVLRSPSSSSRPTLPAAASASGCGAASIASRCARTASSASRSALSPWTAATNWIVPTTASFVGRGPLDDPAGEGEGEGCAAAGLLDVHAPFDDDEHEHPPPHPPPLLQPAPPSRGGSIAISRSGPLPFADPWPAEAAGWMQWGKLRRTVAAR